MGKVKTIILNPDMTYSEKNTKTEGKHLIINRKHWTPTFTLGRSVFRKLTSKWRFWQRTNNLVLVLDEAQQCFELHDGTTKELEPHIWTMKEIRKYVAKILAKSKAEQKIINTTHFIILAVMIAGVLVFQFFIMRGLGLIG